MKSKQTMLMFAIATFAVMGMVAPAFAGAIVSTQTNLYVSGSVSTDSDSTSGCVATGGQTAFTQHLTVVDATTDSITVEWNGAGCSDVDTVKVEVFIGGTEVYDVTHTNAHGDVTIYTDIDSNDRVRGYVTFYD